MALNTESITDYLPAGSRSAKMPSSLSVVYCLMIRGRGQHEQLFLRVIALDAQKALDGPNHIPLYD